MLTKKLSAFDLKAASGETQNTYLGDYITATTVITGTNRDQTSTIFTTSAGQFLPPTNIILNPQHLKEENISLQAGMQKLTIFYIMLVPPNPEQEGYVAISCSFTDVYGEKERQYTGLIANWNLAPAN